MQDIFFENFHTAMVNYPYMDFNSRNINYLSHFHEEIEITYGSEHGRAGKIKEKNVRLTLSVEISSHKK